MCSITPLLSIWCVIHLLFFYILNWNVQYLYMFLFSSEFSPFCRQILHFKLDNYLLSIWSRQLITVLTHYFLVNYWFSIQYIYIEYMVHYSILCVRFDELFFSMETITCHYFRILFVTAFYRIAVICLPNEPFFWKLTFSWGGTVFQKEKKWNTGYD